MRPGRTVGRRVLLPAVLGLAAILGFAMPTADALAAVRSSAPTINAIRLGNHPDRFRIVLDATAAIEFKAKLDKDGTALLIDLPGAVWTAEDAGRFARNPGAVGWTARATQHAVRLSIALSRPMTTVATALLPSAGGGHRLVIDMTDGRVGTQGATQVAAAAGTVVASDIAPRPRPTMPSNSMVAARLAMPGPADPSGIALGLAPGMPGSVASGSFAISLGFVPTETALRLGMAPEKPQDASGGNPLKGSTSTSLMGNPMDMDWGFERGAFAVKMSPPGEGDLIWASRLRFRDKSLTLGVMMPF